MDTLVVILGSTAVGKTELSIDVATMLHCPILNCDSRQLYSGLAIGTCAPTMEQQRRVKHYFVGTLSIHDYFSAARYEEEAISLLCQLFQRHHVAVLSGGSMLYIDAVCHGIDDIPTIPVATRSHIRQRLEAEGLPSLYADLQERDPAYAAIIDRRNTQRVVHALEICEFTGNTYTSYRVRAGKQRSFRILKIGLVRPRAELFSIIGQRTEDMMRRGFLDEAKKLYPYRAVNALNTVGYKELFQVINGEWSLPMAVERIKKNTRVYAKKQLTWFARDKDIHWFHPTQVSEIKALIEATIRESHPVTL